MRRRTRLTNQPAKKFTLKQIPLGWVILGILIVTQIFFTIQTATMGAELSMLEHKSIEITKKNMELQAQLVSRSSLSESQEAAENLGYIKPMNVVFMKNNAAVTALR